MTAYFPFGLGDIMCGAGNAGSGNFRTQAHFADVKRESCCFRARTPTITAARQFGLSRWCILTTLRLYSAEKVIHLS